MQLKPVISEKKFEREVKLHVFLTQHFRMASKIPLEVVIQKLVTGL